MYGKHNIMTDIVPTHTADRGFYERMQSQLKKKVITTT